MKKVSFFFTFNFFPHVLNTQNDNNGATETVVLPHVSVFFLFFLFQTSRASRCGGFEDDVDFDDDGSKKSPSPSFLWRTTVIIVLLLLVLVVVGGVETASLV